MKPTIRIAADGRWFRQHLGGFGWMGWSGPYASAVEACAAPANFMDAAVAHPQMRKAVRKFGEPR